MGSIKTILISLLPQAVRNGIGSLKTVKISRTDSVTVVIVAVVSIFSNLAVGVGAGAIVCSVLFAWTHGREIQLLIATGGVAVADESPGVGATVAFRSLMEEEQKAVIELGMFEETWDAADSWEAGAFPADLNDAGEPGSKMAAAAMLGYTAANWVQLTPGKIVHKTLYVEGALFFGSARVFEMLFSRVVIKACPKYTYLNFSKGKVPNFSAVNALQSLAGMFKEEGRELHLSELCRKSRRTIDKVFLYMDGPQFLARMIEDDTDVVETKGEAWAAKP